MPPTIGTVAVVATYTFAEIAGRYASGRHAGACNLPQGPVAQWASVTGVGNVKFG